MIVSEDYYSRYRDMMVSRGRAVDIKRIGNNTVLRREGDAIALVLHDTAVVTFFPDGSLRLDSGGYRTVTTKDRMGWSPVTVRSVRGRWYVRHSAAGRDSEPIPFFDGITFNRDGKVTNPKGIPNVGKEDARNRKVSRAIARYVSLYSDDRIRALVESAADGGSRGDCLFCQMTTEGRPLGDALGDTEHLTSHIAEGYTMVSLAYNAVSARGYRDPAIILRFSPDSVRRSITRYLRRALLSDVQSDR